MANDNSQDGYRINLEREAQKHELLGEVRWRANNLKYYTEYRDNVADSMSRLPQLLDPEFSRLERLAYAAHVQYYQSLVDLGEYSQRRLETLSKSSGGEKK